ncbi:chromosome transmission fidelity protein 18 [[Candida] anglica]|uniref:Chromosome transmission fidelity protein 18 n=1 Tax=[Candida] anglica TaxID=148631 RepID=A0ABP0EHI7_9ASCO
MRTESSVDTLNVNASMISSDVLDAQGPVDPVPSSLGESFLFGFASTTTTSSSNSTPLETSKDNYSSKTNSISPPEDGENFPLGSFATKTARLVDGTTLELKPKKKSPTNQFTTSSSTGNMEFLTETSSTSIVSMDKLFAQVTFRQSLRASNEKLHKNSSRSRQGTTTTGTASLWTEKYRPSNFMELCSSGNDRQYRSILHWLKKWSGVVFGEDVVPPPASGRGFANQNSSFDTVDDLGRPYKKILLVHGPPGVGKTLTAHMLAEQLGYSVQEVNAANSMDLLPGGGDTSTTNALKIKIMNALTSNTLTSKGRPTCLIIDEVDSSVNSNEIIRVLTDLVYADNRTTNHPNIAQKGKPFQLNRPIICIANDIYSGGPFSMEKLRPHCEMVAFRKPMSSRGASGIRTSGNAQRSVKDYLMKISDAEKLGLDNRGIGEVVEVCDGDLRACINYLQFSGRRIAGEEVSNRGGGIAGHSLSLKDNQLSWFAMVDLLFKRDQSLSKDENFDVLVDLVTNGSGKAASTGGNIEKVIKGCFARYLDVEHYQDDSLVKPGILSDWLSFYDTLGGGGGDGIASDNYSPAVCMKIWSLFSEINPNKGQQQLIPNAKSLDFESFEQSKQNKAILKRVVNSLPLPLRVCLGDSIDSITFPGYFLPYLEKMLTPGATLSSRNDAEYEQLMISHIAELIKSLDIRLEHHRDLETHQVRLLFSPEWETMTQFETSLAPMSPAVLDKFVQNKRQWMFPMIKAEMDKTDSFMTKKRTLGKLERSKIPDIDEDEKESKRARVTTSADYFKARYDDLATQIKDDSTSKPVNHETSRIWVKYHEGFSNAVRKNVGWEDLWIPTHKLDK